MSYHKLKELISKGSLKIGSVVWFEENYLQIPYILVNKGYLSGDTQRDDVVVFMRKYADPNVSVSFFENATYNENRQYEGNTLDNYLCQTHLNKFSANVRNTIVPVMITSVNRYGKITKIGRSVFAPSATEIGFGKMDGCNPGEGSKFDYFSDDATAENRRIFKDTKGNEYEWNTRTRNCGNGATDPYYCIGVKESGEYEKARWQINTKAVRPCFCISEESTIKYSGSTYTAIGNMPPEAPAVKAFPSTAMCNLEFLIEWSESKNGDNDIDKTASPKYQVQAKKDDGEWEDVSTTSLTTYVDCLPYDTVEKITYRVRAIDNYSNYSEWTEFPEIDVINNIPPEAPSLINVIGQFTESPIAVSWGASTDKDYNLSGYRLYRSVDGEEFELVYEGPNTSFSEVSGNWNTVTYRVCAYDTYNYESAFAEKEKVLEAKCTIKLSVSENSLFVDNISIDDSSSDEEGVFPAIYNLEDSKEGLTYVVTLAIDGEEFMSIEDATTGEVTFNIPFDVWQKWLNGNHVLSVKATDPEGKFTELQTPFLKMTHSLELELAEPICMNEPTDRFLLSVKGYFPEGAIIRVTNNANDDSPEWQELTEEQCDGKVQIFFENENISNGFAFNLSITASSSEGDGYLTSVSGIIGKNVFELIKAKVSELEERVDALES